MPITPRTFSVYGGAGGRGTRISSSSSPRGFNPVDTVDVTVYGGAGGRGTPISSFSSPIGFYPDDTVDVIADEKAAMQNLDRRIASYLTKVQSLEKTNAELRKKIREWYDRSNYQVTIEDLKERVSHGCLDNVKILLEVNNVRQAANNFQMMYENELCIKTSIEADVAGLRNYLDSCLTLCQSDLELNYKDLKEELAFLKKKHDEDLASVRNNADGMLNVSVDAAPSMDPKEAITCSSEDFDAAAEKYITELEDWYQNRDNKPQKEEITHSDELQNNLKLIREMKNEYPKLETYLQFQHKKRIVDEGTLEERNAKYCSQLSNLQVNVTNLEDQLSLIHSKNAQNKQDYDALLDIKTRLEQEIAEYRIRFLERKDTVTEPTVDASAEKSSEKVDDKEKNNKSG